MTSFVVENLQANKRIARTPKYKSKVKYLSAIIMSNILKFSHLSLFNIRKVDKYWDYFLFLSLTNRSPIVWNLTLSYYYHHIRLFNKKESRHFELSKATRNFNNSLTLIGLPISFRVTNFILFYNLFFLISNYGIFYKNYNNKLHYSYINPTLSAYNNVNFYYLKSYEH